MSTWAALSDKYPGARRRSLAAEVDLSEAYRAVFLGTPSREQQQVVLADFMAASGFAAVSPPSVSSDELRHREGMRALFACVYSALSLSPADMDALGNAARREAATLADITNEA